MSIRCIIMAGGSGKRFWPLSTPNKPKQCLSFNRNNSLLQNTIQRATSFVGCDISVLTGPVMANEVKKQLVQYIDVSLLIEPSARDTFACFLWAIVQAKSNGNENIIIWPSDHDIAPVKKWIFVNEIAIQESNKFDLMVIGIKPTTPHTGYGYIEIEEQITNGLCQPVISFHEKPNFDIANEYFKSNNHLWNSGVIVANVENTLALIVKLYPKLVPILPYLEMEVVDESIWDKIPATSFDYAVLEKSKNIGVVATNIQWNDLGSWDSIKDILPKQQGHATTAPKLISIDSTNCIIYTNKRVSLIDIDDLIIVETEDELLIMDAKSAQRVKEINALIDKE
jgi:mannose-1-phosphate guanylyltransferase